MHFVLYGVLYVLLVVGAFDAALVSGATGLNILSVGFLVLANANEYEATLKEPDRPSMIIKL